MLIVIGVLAVTAAPRFLDIEGDARRASLEAFEGAFIAAEAVVSAEVMIEGLEDHKGVSIVNGVTILDGYIDLTVENLNNMMVTDGYTVVEPNAQSQMKTLYVFPKGITYNKEVRTRRCAIVISRSTSSGGAKYGKTNTTLVDSEC